MLTESLTSDPDVTALQFKFEMLPTDELTRLASAKVGASLKEIYSARRPLDSETLEDVKASMREMAKRSIYTVERAGTPQQIISTIMDFAQQNQVKKLLVTLDHTLLIKGEDEKGTIDRFMKDLVDLKKLLAQE